MSAVEIDHWVPVKPCSAYQRVDSHKEESQGAEMMSSCFQATWPVPCRGRASIKLRENCGAESTGFHGLYPRPSSSGAIRSLLQRIGLESVWLSWPLRLESRDCHRIPTAPADLPAGLHVWNSARITTEVASIVATLKHPSPFDVGCLIPRLLFSPGGRSTNGPKRDT